MKISVPHCIFTMKLFLPRWQVKSRETFFVLILKVASSHSNNNKMILQNLMYLPKLSWDQRVWLIPSLVEEAKINLAVRHREVFQRIQNLEHYKKKRDTQIFWFKTEHVWPIYHFCFLSHRNIETSFHWNCLRPNCFLNFSYTSIQNEDVKFSSLSIHLRQSQAYSLFVSLSL